ncbi:hypothetical protein QN277_005814 [Acacia crassicarpa]|uniref:Integrase catalytic domain-containing protein n=1 Tax=Acacia crassicarpa TaxID=499986 RepID=A0AAE1IXX5_9FABA|nr:hypothetical protein QN277_005814 [Acacia crassicarpa]
MSNLDIKRHFSSVEHPQSNGQAESANKIFLDELMRRMLQADTSWTEQLHSVLWAYRTSVQSSTQETPFRLTYGCKAMILVEIGQPSWRKVRAKQEGQESNNDALKTDLDLIDEIQVTAQCRELAAKQLLAAKYNRQVRPRSFNRGNFVLRQADIGNKNAKDGKLAANWEGPYWIKERLDGGAYILATLARKPVKRTWNADKLKIYHS